MARFRAKPVEVDAWSITSVGKIDQHGGASVVLDDGKEVYADGKMTARYFPPPGDYWVKQSDGYIYLNPKQVFERKYEPIPLEERIGSHE